MRALALIVACFWEGSNRSTAGRPSGLHSGGNVAKGCSLPTDCVWPWLTGRTDAAQDPGHPRVSESDVGSIDVGSEGRSELDCEPNPYVGAAGWASSAVWRQSAAKSTSA